jgi:hypothetical protein
VLRRDGLAISNAEEVLASGEFIAALVAIICCNGIQFHLSPQHAKL